MMVSVLLLYRRITRWPAGHWIFLRLVCFKAACFATIALCNQAELSAAEAVFRARLMMWVAPRKHA
jgi:hypothetical protein